MEANKNRFIKGSVPVILIRILLIVSAAILLCYFLVTAVFSSLGLSEYVRLEVTTMHNHASYIADKASVYLEKRMSKERFDSLIGDDTNIWNASVYVYDREKKLVGGISAFDAENDTELIADYVGDVFSGSSVEVPGGILVGVPVTSKFGNVIGAVFMIKPVSEVHSEMAGMKDALRAAFIMAFVAMLLPIYITVSYSIERPVKRMTDAAERMAAGDYNTTAEIRGRGELAVLGRSLNELATSLNGTIGDLRAERNLLDEILSGMEDGVIAFDLESRLLRHNPAAARLMGCGDTIPFDNDVMRTVMDHAEQLSDENTSIVFNTASGERILHIRMNLIRHESSNGYILALLHDVTESARYEQSRKDYVANVSHELRTPVANIKGIAEALCDGLVSEENQHRYYNHLYTEADRLSRLIDDLLELSRMQAGKLSVTKRKMDVYELIMGVTDRFSHTAEENGTKLVTDCPEQIAKAYSNEDRIEQVLIILIDNAIKHSASGDVVVRAQEINASQITVSVENEGQISDDDIPHLFERFYKADRAHSGGGSGLGLSIASEIMGLLNEKLWVTSENGRVTFAFTLSIYRNNRTEV